MRKFYLRLFALFLFCLCYKQTYSCHGLAIVNFSFSVGASGVTVNGKSDSPTCGCGPYWMQVEVACTAAGLTGVPTSTIQSNLKNWTGPGVSYNTFPWYNSLLNVPNYTKSAGWPDVCTVEPYNSVFIDFSGLCPGQKYYFAAREWVGGSNSPGPWTATNSFTVPGIFVPLTASLTANPSTICAGQCASLTVSNINGGCGTHTVGWSNGATGLTQSVCPASTTSYTATVDAGSGCQTFTVPVTVTVIPNINAAFTASANQCLAGNSFTFTNTGTAGATHTWNFGDGNTGTGTPVTHTYTTAGTYTVTHTATIGGCSATSTVVITVYPIPNPPVLTPTNPSCGNCNGSISVAATGGNTPYTYSLNGGGFQTSNSFTGLCPGTYTITVQTSNGCTKTATVTLTNQPGPAAVVLTPSNTGCGAPTGQIVIGAVTGGTSGFTYSLNSSTGPFTSATTYTALPAGTYTVYVKDANGCVYNQNVTIGTASGPTAFTFTTAPTACTSNTGSISVTGVTGGTAAYTYSFDNGVSFGAATSQNALAAGSYTVVVKDANGCTFSQVITVTTVPGPTNITYSNVNARCGLNNGTINATGVGGTPGYMYSVNGGTFQSSGTFTNEGAATYNVVVKDVNGCTYTNTTSITNAGNPTAVVSSVTAVSCSGGNNGSATITGTGGTPAYNFTLLSLGTTNVTGVFSGLSAGNYSVTLSDVNTCTATVTFTITAPPPVTNSITATTNVSCNGGSNGSVTASGGGGTPGYTYSINGGASQSSATFTGKPAGNYTVTVTDLNGCQAQATATITQPTPVIVSMSSGNANCTASNGSASVAVTGGTPVYTYSWSPSGGSAATTTGVAAGNYTVTVKDANLCATTGTVTVGQTPGGVATITNINNVSCNGSADGSMSASITSTGASAYTYAWAPSGGSAQTATGLGPATYTVTITDNFGCISTATASITQPTALTSTLSITNVSCNGGSDGTITASASGGTTPYTYAWTPSVGSSNSVSALPVGNYTCVVSDAHNCPVSHSVTLNQPTLLDITATVTNSTCNQPNGAIALVGTGGFSPYQFSINNGAFAAGTSFTGLAAGTYTITIQDAFLCTRSFPVSVLNTSGPTATISSFTNVSCYGACNGNATISVSGGTGTITYSWSNGQTTPIATNLCDGIYTVNATDQNGCVATVGVTITQPTPLTSSASFINPSCFGGSDGSASVSPAGGVGPYTFAWTPSPSLITQTINGLSAGPMSVIVTDANNCTSSSNVLLVNPPALLVTVTGTDPLCNSACNGSAAVNVTNGTAPFVYSWSDSNGQTTPTAGGLCAGSYTVNVTDANGCPGNGSIILSEPTAIVAIITSSGPSSCSGVCDGWAQGSASGGSGVYSFSWSSGAVGTSATGLCDSTYIFEAKDHYGCTSVASVVITEPNPLTISVTGSNATCFGECNGTATASYGGGTGPYSFLWLPSLSTVYNPAVLCSGTHTVTIVDANNCSQTATINITEPNQLVASTSVTNSHCQQSDGSANVHYSGGTPPVNIQWSNGITTNTNAAIAGGVYNVMLTDSHGCVVNAVANVNDINGPNVAITSSANITCFGYHNGSATATVSGGTLPYNVQHWLPGGTTALAATGLYPGFQTFQVIDSAGCNASVSVNITQPSSFITDIITVNNVSCFGLCDGSATMMGAGGTPFSDGSYDLLWSDGQTVPALTNVLCAGTFSCTATDSLGCQSSATVIITQPQLLLINDAPGASPITCYEAENGSVVVSVTGGNVPYNYMWSPSIGTGPFVTGLEAGTDTLLVTDNKGCSAQAIYTITEPPPLTLDSTVVTAICGLSNGSATVTPTGGTPLGTAPFYNYLWNTSPSVTTTAAATSLGANTYNCTVTDANGCTQNISVVVGNIAGPALVSTIPDSVSCNGLSDGNITVTINGGTTPFTYDWINGSGVSLNQNSATLSNEPAGLYAVTITDANGCILNSTAAIKQPNPLTLFVNPHDTICFGQTGNVYCASGGGTQPYTFNWTNGAGSFTGAGPIPVTPLITTTYSVTVTDDNNCTIPGVQTAILVRPALTSSTHNITACDKDSVSISDTASGGNGGPYTYNWAALGAGQTQTVAVSSNQTPAAYVVTISDGCTLPITDTVFVNALPLPFAGVVPSIDSGCALTVVNFAGVTDIGTQFFWDFGDSAGTSGQNAVHTYMQAGVYDVAFTAISAQGCTTVVVKPQLITMFPVPVADFTFQPIDPSVLNPIVQFTNTSVTAVDYRWDFGIPLLAGDTSSLVDPNYAYDESGSYTVTLIAISDHGCRDTTENIIVISPAFALFVPNAFTPNEDGVNDIFLPKGVGVDESRYHFYVFDRWGQKIFESNNWATGWDGKANGGSEPAQMDVYVWKIECKDFKGDKHSFVGHVSIVR